MHLLRRLLLLLLLLLGWLLWLLLRLLGWLSWRLLRLQLLGRVLWRRPLLRKLAIRICVWPQSAFFSDSRSHSLAFFSRQLDLGGKGRIHIRLLSCLRSDSPIGGKLKESIVSVIYLHALGCLLFLLFLLLFLLILDCLLFSPPWSRSCRPDRGSTAICDFASNGHLSKRDCLNSFSRYHHAWIEYVFHIEFILIYVDFYQIVFVLDIVNLSCLSFWILWESWGQDSGPRSDGRTAAKTGSQLCPFGTPIFVETS
jgi:hypothetical protein